jgi:hypothetical protein
MMCEQCEQKIRRYSALLGVVLFILVTAGMLAGVIMLRWFPVPMTTVTLVDGRACGEGRP